MTSLPWNSRESFLGAFHADHPGITAAVFARGRTDAGVSSYELLANEAAAHSAACPGMLIELGCGDGYLLDLLFARGVPAARLLGIDLSAHELACARGRPQLADVALVRQRAQMLPLASGCASAVLAHLSLMLMGPLEPVLDEAARVLRPGGILAAVIGGGPAMGDNAYWHFAEALGDVYGRSSRKVPQLSDTRLRTDAGIAELFAPQRGFASLEIRDLYLHVDGSWEQVWSVLSSFYECYVLGADEMAMLAEKLHARLSQELDTGGLVPCTFQFRYLRCTRSA